MVLAITKFDLHVSAAETDDVDGVLSLFTCLRGRWHATCLLVAHGVILTAFLSWSHSSEHCCRAFHCKLTVSLSFCLFFM